MTFGNHFFKLLTSIWAPKTPPKGDPTRVQYQNTKIIDFDDPYTLWAHSGVMKIVIFEAFLVPFSKYRFWTSFWSILDHFGDPFGPLWAPKKHPKKETKKRLRFSWFQGSSLEGRWFGRGPLYAPGKTAFGALEDERVKCFWSFERCSVRVPQLKDFDQS